MGLLLPWVGEQPVRLSMDLFFRYSMLLKGHALDKEWEQVQTVFSETVIIDKGLENGFSKWSLDYINIKKTIKKLISEYVNSFLNKGIINNGAKQAGAIAFTN